MKSIELHPSAEVLEKLSRDIRDEVAWRDLYQQMRPFVWATVFRFFHGSHDLAEDICQDVFSRLVKYAPFEKLKSPIAFRAYLRTLTRNACYEALSLAKRQSRENNFSEIGGVELDLVLAKEGRSRSSEGPEPLSIELNESMERMLSQLSALDAQIIRHLVEGHTLPQIAELVSLTYQNTATRLSRIRVKLRNYLEISGLRESEKTKPVM